MSYSPQALDFFLPTGGSLPGEFTSYHEKAPMSLTSSPNDHAVFVPARQAYSHSASLGRRTTSFSPSSFSLRNRAVTLVQKVLASSQVTISTELRTPRHLAGFLP